MGSAGKIIGKAITKGLEERQAKIELLETGLQAARQQIQEYKADVKELQQELIRLQALKLCPTLLTAREEIETLQRQLQEIQDYERNSLAKE